ncbi:hypothetical protein LCGC14_0594840 [marine sediment metagenome]|uniref:Endonuclease GajA/Old nuclease/RecF-like AAA domain-containing protein n=1 Tax=marine sediment metagenome TaxID=412755 RepID=A0A0F9TYH8_9ZZZZ
MIVKNLNVKEFRGIRSCESPIELSNFNVLLGRNNSGKSTILEALSLLPYPEGLEYVTGMNKLDFISNLHKQSQSSKGKLSPYKTLLYQYTGTSTIEYNSINNKSFRVSISATEFDCNFKPAEVVRSKVNKDTITKYPDYIINFIKMVSKQSNASVLFIPYDTNYIKKIEDKLDVLMDLIIKNGIHVKVAKSLNKCVDDEYSEILFGEPMKIRKVFPNNFTYVRLNDLGSGAEKLIKIMLLIDSINPKLILIDDFEAGLHPTMIDIFLKWLINTNSQVVISTHSLDILYRLTEINPLDCNILFLKKSHKDNLKHDKLSLDEIEDLLNANTDPRKFNF